MWPTLISSLFLLLVFSELGAGADYDRIKQLRMEKDWLPAKGQLRKVLKSFEERDQLIWDLVTDSKFDEADIKIEEQLELLEPHKADEVASAYTPLLVNALRLGAICKLHRGEHVIGLLEATRAGHLGQLHGAPWANIWLERMLAKANKLDSLPDHELLGVHSDQMMSHIEQAYQVLEDALSWRQTGSYQGQARKIVKKLSTLVEAAYTRLTNKQMVFMSW